MGPQLQQRQQRQPQRQRQQPQQQQRQRQQPQQLQHQQQPRQQQQQRQPQQQQRQQQRQRMTVVYSLALMQKEYMLTHVIVLDSSAVTAISHTNLTVLVVWFSIHTKQSVISPKMFTVLTIHGHRASYQLLNQQQLQQQRQRQQSQQQQHQK